MPESHETHGFSLQAPHIGGGAMDGLVPLEHAGAYKAHHGKRNFESQQLSMHISYIRIYIYIYIYIYDGKTNVFLHTFKIPSFTAADPTLLPKIGSL